MQKHIVRGVLALAVALAGCAHANTQLASATKVVSKRTITWSCPAGTMPDKGNIQPNCDATIPTAQAQARAEPRATPRRAPVFEKRVEFSTDSAELTAASKDTLNQVVEAAKADPSLTVIYVIGHTDNTGPQALNDKLSAERADAVKSYLEEQGVSVKLDTRALGENAPVASNESSQGRTINRSAVIIGVKQAQPRSGG